MRKGGAGQELNNYVQHLLRLHVTLPVPKGDTDVKTCTAYVDLGNPK